MCFSNRAFGSKTTRNREYHRLRFRSDTNHCVARIVPVVTVPGPPFASSCGFQSPGRPSIPRQFARSTLGQAGWIVLFRSNFRFSRVEDRPRVEQSSMPIGHNSSLSKAAQAKYTPTWLDHLTAYASFARIGFAELLYFVMPRNSRQRTGAAFPHGYVYLCPET